MNNTETAIAGDANKLANDGKAALDEAAAPLADKVRELHEKGIVAMDQVADTYEEALARAARAKSQAAAATNAFVRENPWRSTLVAGLIGVLAGVAIARH